MANHGDSALRARARAGVGRSRSPLLGALDDIRLKMNRQTIRFLGDAETEREPPMSHPPPPPATRPTYAYRPRSRRRSRSRSRSHRLTRCAGHCCIRVRCPSVSIMMRGLQEDQKVTRVRAGTRMMITVPRTAAEPLADTCSAHQGGVVASPVQFVGPPPTEGPAMGLPESSPSPIQVRESPNSVPATEIKKANAAARTPTSASVESLGSYVTRKVRVTLHQVSEGLRGCEQPAGAENNADQVLRQVSRVAAYTAACRHLKHAINLYVLASLSTRRSRKGRVRYKTLGCPPAPPPPPPAVADSRDLPTPEADQQSAEKTVHINDLPKAVLLRVFSKLSQRELSLHVAPVCRAWHRLARTRRFWRELAFDAAYCPYSAESLCSLLRVTPGLWTLELIACRDVDVVLAEVCRSCHKLRTLVLDSCTVSSRLRASAHQQLPDQTEAGSVLAKLLEQCVCLQYLIVAFTPHLYSPDFFPGLARRCWDMQCFLVSADDEDVREFCNMLCSETPGLTGSEALLTMSGSWSVPSPSSSPASASCKEAHPARERDTAQLRRRVTAVHTRNNILRVLALRPDSELRLLQWRMTDTHAMLDYFGVEARLSFE